MIRWLVERSDQPIAVIAVDEDRAAARGFEQLSERVLSIPRRFGDGPHRPSTFEVGFVVGGVRHGYWLEVDDSAVLYETLHSYPERRRRTLFEREGDDISFRWTGRVRSRARSSRCAGRSDPDSDGRQLTTL